MSKEKVLLSFDIEEFDIPEEYGAKVPDDLKFEIPKAGAERLLDLLDRTGAKVTFFVTCSFAEKFPDLLKRMAAKHEIASHGMNHTTFEIPDLKKSRERLSGLSGQNVRGCRMARLAPVAPEEMLKAGYIYDSSVNPIWLPGRYNNTDKPVVPYLEKCGLLRFPISVATFFRLPLFWLSFKNLPQGIYHKLAWISCRKNGFFNMYSHPWEYDCRTAEKRWKLPSYISAGAGDKMLGKLESLILFFRSRQIEFSTFSEYLSENLKHE